MRVFLAGVMQASLPGKGIVDQSYRNALGEALDDLFVKKGRGRIAG